MTKHRTIQRAMTLVTTAVVAAAPLAWPMSAKADVKYHEEIKYDFGDGKCVKGRAETSHGSYNKGYIKTSTLPKRRYGQAGYGIDCYTGWHQNAGDMTTKTILFKYVGNVPGANNGWAVCIDYAWQYNSIGGSGLEATRNYSTTPCGTGWYGNQGFAKIKYNGTWTPSTSNSKTWSGPHYLPVS